MLCVCGIQVKTRKLRQQKNCVQSNLSPAGRESLSLKPRISNLKFCAKGVCVSPSIAPNYNSSSSGKCDKKFMKPKEVVVVVSM
jgi:hypothetical protein